MTRITTFLIAILTVSLAASAIGILASALNAEYPVTNYNESEIEVYAQMNATYQDIQNTTAEFGNLSKSNPDWTDLLGAFFMNSIQAVKTTGQSMGIATTMATQATDDIAVGAMAGPLRLYLTALILILIIIGVFMAAAVKWNL